MYAIIGYAIEGELLISVQLSATKLPLKVLHCQCLPQLVMPLVKLLISVQLSTKIANKSLALSVFAVIGYAISYAPYLSATVYQNHP